MEKKSNLYRAINTYLKPFIPLIILNVLVSSIAGGQTIVISFLTKNLTDDVFINKDMAKLFFVIGGMVGLSLVTGICVYFRNYLGAYISGKITMNIRTDMYKKLQSFTHEYFSESKTGDIMTRFQVDTDRTLEILTVAFRALSESLRIVGCMGYLFYVDWSLAIICIVVLPFATTILRKYSKRLRATGKNIQESHGRLNNILQESISGIRVIKAFANEEYAIEQYIGENTTNFKYNIKNRRLDARVKPLVEFFTTCVVAMVALYGGSLVIKEILTAGELMSFLVALGLMVDPMKKVTEINNKVNTALPSVDRIYEILDVESEIREVKNPVDIKGVKGKIKFDNVQFSYDKVNPVIKDFNLDVKEGEMVALVGRSGSGKSTLVNLVPRFYDTDEGSIEIDGINVREFKLKNLRKNIGIVPQDTFLFSGTIYDNIKYGKREATKEEVIKAAEMANAYNFIMELPNGFDTEVGERGVLLSGGQKQRISIARAILENPPIMILDEATSALDTESERLVQDALDKLMTNRTTFVIAHRLSTILHADKIVVMEDGEIKEMGKHEELLETDGIYKKLYETQFGKIEN